MIRNSTRRRDKRRGDLSARTPLFFVDSESIIQTRNMIAEKDGNSRCVKAIGVEFELGRASMQL